MIPSEVATLRDVLMKVTGASEDIALEWAFRVRLELQKRHYDISFQDECLTSNQE